MGAALSWFLGRGEGRLGNGSCCLLQPGSQRPKGKGLHKATCRQERGRGEHQCQHLVCNFLGLSDCLVLLKCPSLLHPTFRLGRQTLLPISCLPPRSFASSIHPSTIPRPRPRTSVSPSAEPHPTTSTLSYHRRHCSCPERHPWSIELQPIGQFIISFPTNESLYCS